METEKIKDENNERKVKTYYANITDIIGSVKVTALTPINFVRTLTYHTYVELYPAKSEIKQLIKALSKLKIFSDYFRIEIRNKQAYIIVENKDWFSESIKYEFHFIFDMSSHNNANTKDFSITFNIEYFLSILKNLNPDGIAISFEENLPLVILDSNNAFVLAPVVF